MLGWLDQVAATWTVLALDGLVMRAWTKLMIGKSEESFEDGIIAAVASVHRLTVVTRNVKDISAFGVPIFNPFR